MGFTLVFIVNSIFVICNGESLYSGIHQASESDQSFEHYQTRKITENEINKTLSFVHTIYQRMATREEILGYAQVKMKEGTPSHKLFMDSYPEPEALAMMRSTLEAVAASAQIHNEYCPSSLRNNVVCVNDLRQIELWNTPLQESCQRLVRKCTNEHIFSKYRTLDGSCNENLNGVSGQSFTAYSRLLPPGYLGGIKEDRRSVTKQALPSARLVSSNLDLKTGADLKASLAVLFWGKFLEHDLSHTAMRTMIHTGEPIQCCDQDGRSYLPRYEHPFCMPITVPSTDSYYGDKEVTCLSYVRSLPAIDADCALGPMQQMNQATHFLDGSQIYGTTKLKSDNLRSFTNGQLSSLGCKQEKTNSTCVTRDEKTSFDPHMRTMYSIWIKEHNRIANLLTKLNPIWDDEQVFQEARRIVIAEMQHITYNEWIPAVLGTKIAENDTSTDPTVSNEFATAAIRALQSVLLKRLSFTEEETKFVNQTETNEDLIEDMVNQRYKSRGLYYIGKSNNVTFGYDVLSIDIQRGRDHGLATYLEYRTYCGLPTIDNFEDLEPIMTPKAVAALKKSYKRVEDIDLIVGGLTEKPQRGLFGPTISCILKEQFEKTRSSDRYFYTNARQPVPFSDSQMEEIKRVTLSRIICDNSDSVTEIQRNVFETISLSNPRKMCEEIPKLNLRLWSDERFKYT